MITSDSLSKELVVKNRAALTHDLSSISFAILSSNRQLVHKYGARGEVGVQGLGRVQFFNPVSYDAKAQQVMQEVVSLTPDQQMITITPDQQFLHAKERVFPLVIDPGITTSVTQDTFVSSSTIGSPQGGTAPRKSIFIGNYYDITVPAWYMQSKGYLQFPAVTPTS